MMAKNMASLVASVTLIERVILVSGKLINKRLQKESRKIRSFL